MKQIKRITNGIIVGAFIALVSIVFIQVIFRYLLGHSLPWVDEVSRYLFVWVIYLGGSITVKKGINITFDLVLDGLPNRSWNIVFTLVNIICVAFLALIVILGFDIAYVNRVQYSSLLRIPMGLVCLAIPIGGILMIISQIEYYFETKTKRMNQIC